MALTAAHPCFAGFSIDGVPKKISQSANLWSVMRGSAAENQTPTVTLDFDFVWEVSLRLGLLYIVRACMHVCCAFAGNLMPHGGAGLGLCVGGSALLAHSCLQACVCVLAHWLRAAVGLNPCKHL